MAYTKDQLVDLFTKANMGKAPDAATTLTLDAFAQQTQTGGITDATALTNTLKLLNSTTAVAISTYQFFNGYAPSQAGLDYLVDSTTNTNDLNDAYYAPFAQENRFISMAINQGAEGAGKAAFATNYTGVSITQTIATAYDKIIGNAVATAAGVDVAAANAYFGRAENLAYLNAFVKANTAFTTAADIDLAVKAALIGQILSAAASSGIGGYAAATKAMLTDLSDGTLATDNAAGVNLFTAYPAAATSGGTFTLTTGTDSADSNSSSRSGIDSSASFKFTGFNDTVKAGIGSLTATDVLIDNLTTDTDVLEITLTGTTGAFTAANIETFKTSFAAGTPVLDVTSVSGLKTIAISGAVAGKIDELNAQTSKPTIEVKDYTNTLTVELEQPTGTTATATGEVVSFKVEGAKYGTTATTRTNLTLTADGAGVVETVNIESAGTAANALFLDAGNNVTLATVNLTGATNIDLRVAHGDVTGLKFDASKATGSQTLTIDREGATTVATNTIEFTGFENIAVIDSTVGGDQGSLSGLKSGQTVTFASTFTGADTTLGFAGVTGTSDTATVVLDNLTDNTDTDLVKLDIQDVETLTITSSGKAASTSTTAENLIDDLVGDATTITVSGDTSLKLDLNIDTVAGSSTSARTIKVDASTNTAFVTIEAAAQARNTYELTGTAKDDTLTLNNSGGKITSGDGKDTVKGGDGADTINLGAGEDKYTLTFGADNLTLGAGNDLVTVVANGTGAVAIRGDIEARDINTTVTLAANDKIVAVVNGVSYVTTFDTNATTTLAKFVSDHGAAILAAHNITVTSVDTNTDLKFVGPATGTGTFTVDVSIIDDSVSPTALVAQAETVLGTATAVKDANTTITDFAVGDKIDVAALTLSGAYIEGASAALVTATDYGVIVLTGASYASVLEASTAINVTSDHAGAALVVYLNSTTGKAEAYLDNALNTDAVTGGNDAKVFTFDNVVSLTGVADTFSADSFVI